MKLKATLAALVLTMASSAALAGETVDGTVDMVDQENLMVGLVDGQQFKVTGAHELTNLDVGEKVTITYEEQDGENVVTNINQAEPNN